MVNWNHPLKKVWMLAMIAILLFQPTMLGTEISGTELLNLLSQRDRVFNSTGYKISFVITTDNNQFNDPNQGMVFMDCTVTRAEEGHAMKIVNHYEHPPVFAVRTKPGDGSHHDYRAFDYNADGNLIVWRTLEKYILSTPDRNDTLEKVRVFFVDPNGQIAETDDNLKLHRWPIGSLDSMYEFRQFQLATGRGFSKRLGAVTSVRTLSSGLTKVTSLPLHGSGPEGSWELTIDPNSDYLVREATFTPDGADKPTIEVTSTGVISKDGIKIAKNGVYKSSSGLELSIEVNDISKVVATNRLYEEVRSYLDGPLPSGAGIIDLRGEKPVRTTVK